MRKKEFRSLEGPFLKNGIHLCHVCFRINSILIYVIFVQLYRLPKKKKKKTATPYLFLVPDHSLVIEILEIASHLECALFCVAEEKV